MVTWYIPPSFRSYRIQLAWFIDCSHTANIFDTECSCWCELLWIPRRWHATLRHGNDECGKTHIYINSYQNLSGKKIHLFHNLIKTANFTRLGHAVILGFKIRHLGVKSTNRNWPPSGVSQNGGNDRCALCSGAFRNNVMPVEEC